MDKIQKLKLANIISNKAVKHDYPVTGKAIFTVTMINGQYVNVEEKNVISRKKKED